MIGLTFKNKSMLFTRIGNINRIKGRNHILVSTCASVLPHISSGYVKLYKHFGKQLGNYS